VTGVTYRTVVPADYEAVRAFLASVGWAERVTDSARFALMVEQASRSVVALQQGRVVGFGRAISDGVSNGYLSMVAVEPGMRRRGVGRHIVELLTGNDSGITWVLRAEREGSQGFWERLGFTHSTVAMERTRGID
jgi:ribosomal protein S18 acetylase RimI-like enzyme